MTVTPWYITSGNAIVQTFICKYCWACSNSIVFCSMMPMYCRIFLLVTRSSLPSMSWMTEESHRMDRNSSSTPLRSSSSTFFTFTLFFSVASLWDRIFSLFSLKKSKRVSLRRNYSLIISWNAFSILYSIRKFKPTSRSLSIWTRTPSFLMSSFSNCLTSICML